MIENMLYTEKRNANKTAQVAQKLAGLGTIEEVGTAFSADVTSRKDISFSPMSSPSVEPAVLGAILNTQVGEMSGAVQGVRGVYVFKLDRKDAGNFFTEDDAKQYTTQKAQYSSQLIIPVMQEAADVKDDRARYF